jgi:predicted N-formylglutamate amidohydrolase
MALPMPKEDEILMDDFLIQEDELPPFEVINPEGKSKSLIVCDHAGNVVPRKLNYLGLDSKAFENHYAVDIGARGVALKLSKLIDAPCILANYSRLVVDLNRYLDHRTAFLTSCEDGVIPGNAEMKESDKQARIREIYEPYHAEIEKMIEGFKKRKIVPAVISVHSFTKQFYNQERPWEIGVLWVQDDRLPGYVMQSLRDKGYVVGDNEPYDARILWGTTVNTHADSHGFPNLLYEIRNDLISTKAQQEKMAEELADSMDKALQDESLYSLYDGKKRIHDPTLVEGYFDELIKKAKQGE